MAKLLRADFARMWKSRAFWVSFILLFLISASNYIGDYLTDTAAAIDISLLRFSNVIIFAAIFTALYLGTEHSCGGLRNKIAIGHTRAAIYFSNLITCLCGTILLAASIWVPTLLIGLVTGGHFSENADRNLFYALVSFIAAAAMTALFVLIAMLLSRKSTVCTATILIAFGMFLAGAIILSALSEPEYISTFEYTVSGGMAQGEQEKNPLYVSGLKREIMTTVNDIMPTGQIVQIETGQPHNIQLMPLYSAGVFIAVTAAGAVVFRRKDIK